MTQAHQARECDRDPRRANGITVSGTMRRTNRSDTWLHQPAMLGESRTCQRRAVHTWVTIKNVDANALIGRLANQPFEKTSSLKVDDAVRFQLHHILTIQWAHPEAAPPPREYREHWERCLVDESVPNGSEPVEYIYREEPDMQEDGDKYPDSGWRIRGRVGEASNEESSAGKPQYVAIGAVLNRDDSWLSLIDAPIGSCFMRNFSTGIYEAED